MKTKNQMPLRMACIISIMFLCVSTTFGQEKSTQKLLMSNDWVISYPKGSISAVGYRFTNTELIMFIENKYKGEVITNEIVEKYYLSDTNKEETVFDRSKIGKRKTGKYIVYTINNQLVHIDEIIELSDKILSIIVKDPIDGSDSIMTLKARSKAKYAAPANIKR